MCFFSAFPRLLSSKICILILLEIFILCLLDYTPFRKSALPPPQPLPYFEPRQYQAVLSNKTEVPAPKGYCASFGDSSEVLVVLKTGANEVFDKLPTQLLTMLQCVDDLLLFSDLEQDLGTHHIHDVLKNVAEEVKLNNPDFDYYRTLQEHKKNGEDIGKLKETHHDAGWNLDKYKFIRMLEETWRMKPGKKWYVFIEADTYLVWTNLLLWLDRLESGDLLYLGSPTYYDDTSFSHGGSGFILSGAALSKFSYNSSEIVARYDSVAKNAQYGDFILMKALKEKGVEFTHKWPILQGEKPSTIPYGPGPDNGVRHWCQPIVTMHHVNSEVANSIWSYESQRPDVKKPLLLGDLYQHLTKPYISAEKEDWYNLSDDLIFKAPGVEGGSQKNPDEMSQVEKDAHISFENCRKACEEEARCFQYVYFDKTCGFSYSYRLGERRPRESDIVYKSGWNLEKIEKYQTENPCLSPDWM